MNQINLRHPENCLATSNPDIDHKTIHILKLYGEEYRAEKKNLKENLNNKKKVSKEIGLQKNNEDIKNKLIQDVKKISERISSTKNTLKKIEKKINVVLGTIKKTNNLEIKASLPPQFSTQRDNKALTDHIIITELTENDHIAWEEYIQQHPNSSIYHSLSIKNTIENTFNHCAHYFIAKDEHRNIIGVLPTFRIKSKIFGDLSCSLPFFNYGGVLSNNTKISECIISFAWNKLSVLGVTSLELRHTQNNLKLPVIKNKISMILNLPNHSDELWASFSSKLRSQIKKSQSNQLIIKFGCEELISDFYTIFCVNMRDLGTPVYSKQLFINMLAQHASSKIAVVYHNKRPISAGFVIGWKNTLEIPWASTIKKANTLNSNMFLYWNILKYAVDNKYECFDFGRSSKGATTYKFKKQWGAQAYQLYWHYYYPTDHKLPRINTENTKFKMAISIWKKLPLWLTKLIGPHIVKFIP